MQTLINLLNDIPIGYLMLLLCALAAIAGWCLSDMSNND
ncbi:hypothetical protein [Vibrio phage XZ1]|nr:hypothetical protein [Vibrio phage XZ1]